MNPSDFLTPHFRLAELTRTSVRNINNTPPDRQLASLTALCVNILEPVRRQFDAPIFVSSGYRSPNVNDAVGGSAKSQHVLGEAADFHVSGVDHFTVAKWIAESVVFDQLILEFVSIDGFGGWLHCSFVEWRDNRGEILRASRGPLGTAYEKITTLNDQPN